MGQDSFAERLATLQHGHGFETWLEGQNPADYRFKPHLKTEAHDGSVIIVVTHHTPYETELLFKDVPQIDLDNRSTRVAHANNTATIVHRSHAVVQSHGSNVVNRLNEDAGLEGNRCAPPFHP